MGQIIHNTSFPDDGLGDKVRDAFTHQNSMNTELYDDKVDKETGKELSSNDFTDALKTKLLGIEAGAEVNVQPDWSQSDNTQDDYIKNKPTLNNYVNTIGYFNYSNDDTTPLTLVADTEKKLECDNVGAYTNVDHPTHGVTRVFDSTTNNIVLDEFEVGDILLLRTDTIITTTTANQNYKIILRLGIGTANEFEIVILEEQVKSTGSHQKVITTNFTIDSEEVRLALGEIVIISDHAGSVVVNGFHFTGIKRNVNFVELSGGGAVSITGLISEGTNVTITGTGTLADPYVISSSGGSGTTPTLQEVTTEGNVTDLGIKVLELETYNVANDNYTKYRSYDNSTQIEQNGVTTDFTYQSSNRIYEYPDADGMLALKSEITEVNENIVVTLAKNTDGQFAYPHGTITIGGKFFIGTRQGATSKLLRYNGTTLEESITIPCTATIGLESLCTDGTRLYGIRHNASTSYIFDCDPEDFTDIQYNTITGVNLLGSPAIVTDGTYIYGVENTTPACNFFKIQISDWSTVDTNVWSGVGGGHGGKINITDGLAYFSSQNGYFAKVNLSDLTYTQLDLRAYLSIITDDLAFCPSGNNSAFINYAIVGGEYRDNTTGKGGVLIDTDAMTIVEFDLLPTYGLFFNNDYSKLYNVANVGFIEEIDFESFIFNAQYNQPYTRNTYTFRQGGVPNEMFFNTSNEPYCTNWGASGNIFKIELTPKVLPLITERESYYRSLLDALKRDGSNANSDVDLGVYKIIVSEIITQKGGDPANSMALRSNNLSAFRTSEWQDKDYQAIADIQDITDEIAVFKTTEFLDATSSIQGQLNSKQDALTYTPYKFIQVSQTPHTGTTARTIIATATITGNTFPTMESLKFLFGVNKPISVGAYTLRCDINTANTLSGATTTATFTGSATAQVAIMTRIFSLLGGNLYGYPFTTSQLTDSSALLAGTLGSTTFDTTNTIYMFWTIQLVNSLDSVTPNLATLTNN